MSKKYDYKKVKSYRSYKTHDISRLYKDKKLHEQTIRGWVNDGKLEGFLVGKTLYIYGAVLKQFFKDKNCKKTPPLKLNEFKCWKCKEINEPLNKTIEKLTLGMNDCITAYATCPSCKKEMFRNYKRSEEQEILKLFKIKQNVLMGLCDSSNSTTTTNIKTDQKIVLSESLKTESLNKKMKIISSTNKTNIEAEKNISSTKTTNIIPKQLNFFES
jgi:hypothetical protein